MVVLFVSSHYHVVLNRQSSGERGALRDRIRDISNDTESRGDKDGNGDDRK